MAYAKFAGAPLKLNAVDNTWTSPRAHDLGDLTHLSGLVCYLNRKKIIESGDEVNLNEGNKQSPPFSDMKQNGEMSALVLRGAVVPVLTSENTAVTQPANILNFLRKQKYNADYDLSAKEGADTLAYIALLEEKLLPAMLHTFWVDADNYCMVTRPWFASRIPFPLSLYLPGKMSREALNRILVTKGEPPLYSLNDVEAQIYKDAKECLNLLSNRLGTSQFFFGNTPTTLDAFVFGFLAPLYKVHFPKVQLQEHLKQLSNLCRFCDDILGGYFTHNITGFSPAGQDTVDANLQKLTQLVNKESNLIEKMDDNLRKSPQHFPQKLTTLKPTRTGEESSSQHLSP